MKLGAVTRLDSRDKTKLKKFHDDVMSTNCDVTVIFSNLWPIFFQFRCTPCKAEQPLRGMELQEKKHKKIKAYRKSN